MASPTISKLHSFVLPRLYQTLSLAYGIFTLAVFYILSFTSKRAFRKLSQKEKDELEIGTHLFLHLLLIHLLTPQKSPRQTLEPIETPLWPDTRFLLCRW
jgi:hypothetical protein